MSWSIGMAETIPQKFDRLFEIISSQNFMEGKKLGGEIASYIATYAPEDQIFIDDQIIALKNRLDKYSKPVVIINLYHVVIEILQSKNLLDKIFEKESTMPKKRLLDSLIATLDIQKVLLPVIMQKAQSSGASIVFLIGIGQVFPFIRAHSVLNNIQTLVSMTPLVAFFPGEYDGVRLKLFGRLQDQNHYRAFNLDNLP
jgi:hypothetical protein